MLKALFYAYVLGGITFIPLLIFGALFITVYTSVPVGDPDVDKKTRGRLEAASAEDDQLEEKEETTLEAPLETNDIPRTRKGWLTVRRTFEEVVGDGSYVTLVRSLLDSRSKDPKRSRPKDMWYAVLKGKVLYLYEDEDMSECEAAVELSGHQVIVYPEGQPDGELFAKRNAICLRPRSSKPENFASVTKKMQLEKEDVEGKLDAMGATGKARNAQKEVLLAEEKKKDEAREQALDPSTPWFIFVRSNVEMEDWYFSLIHASEQPSQTPTLQPLRAIFEPADMNHLVGTLDEQPDVIPMRWLNALLGRIFFSHYRTRALEAYIVGRLMKKLSKVKLPAFLTKVEVTEVSVGNRAPMFSKPMLKELTKEGDAALEVHLQYKGEIRITIEATAIINLGARFKSYTVKLTLAAVLKELEGNILVKVKRPPSNRIWYAFTQTPRMVLAVEPIVSDRQITWGMILSTIESKLKEIIQESVVMPNMDDIAYFETAEYAHRGGIYSDACRVPHVPSSPESTDQDDGRSVASAPLPEPSFIPLAETASSTMTSKSDTTPIPPDDPPTEATSKAVDDESSNVRRRSWFSSVRSDDNVSISSPDFFSDPAQTDKPEEIRGRSTDTDKHARLRSISTPNNPDIRTESPAPIAVEEPETILQPSGLQPSSSRRSVSQHSIVVPDNIEEDGPSSRSTPSTPRRTSDASQIPRSTSPPSFFSTLKSKAAAADKQALSNTAKEAMRKWGVNWGGFKKDKESSNDDGAGSDTSSKNMGLRSESSTLTHKARASYAEVRAAVAERKEREQRQEQMYEHHMVDGMVSPSYSPLTSAPLHSPTPSRTRLLSTPNGTASSSASSETPAAPSTPSSRLSVLGLTPKKSSPSMGRVSLGTEVGGADTAVEHPLHAHLAEMEPAKVKPMPIHVQPVSKTMSIPGIHASHKNEVQSLGYVAPPQAPAPAAVPQVAETMLKNPAIQTVYRLWKNPSSAAAGGATVADSERPGSRGSTKMEDGDLTSAEVLSPPSSAAAKPAPPPLPPRSTPLSPPVDSASAALKNIVQRDENNRQQHSRSTSGSTDDGSSDKLALSTERTVSTSETVGGGEAERDNQAEGKPRQNSTTTMPPPLPPRGVQTSA